MSDRKLLESLAEDDRRRKKRLAVAFAANVGGNFVLVAEKFLLLPIMLWMWNKDLVGTWYVIRSIPSFLSIGEMGFASVTANQMTYAVEEGNLARARQLYWSTLRLLNTVSAVGLAVTLIALLILPLGAIFKSTYSGFAVATFFSAIHTVSIFQTQALYAAFRSIEMHAGATTAIQTIRVFELVGAVLALLLGADLAAVTMVYAGVRIGGIVLMRSWLRRKISWIYVDRQASWQKVGEIVRPSFAMAGISIAQSLQLQGFTLVLSYFSSPATVANYNALRVLARLPLQVGQTTSRTTWPEITSLFAKGRSEDAIRLHSKTVLTTTIMTFLVTGALLLVARWVFDVWTLGKLEFIPSSFLMLTLSASVISVTLSIAILQMARSTHERIATYWCAAVGVSLAAGIGVAAFFGAVGLTAFFLLIDVLLLLSVWMSARSESSLLESQRG